MLGGAGADSGIGRFLLHPPSCLSKPGPAAATATRRLRGAGKRREAGLAGRGGAGGRGLGGRALVPAARGREARLGLGAAVREMFPAAECPTQNFRRESAKEISGSAELSGTRRGLVSGPLKGELLSVQRGLHLLVCHCMQDSERMGRTRLEPLPLGM